MDKSEIKKMLLTAAKALIEKSDYLGEIDSKFGDGDHGVTITKIATLIEKEVTLWNEAGIKNFFDDLGVNIMSISGGSAGPLWGTMIGGLALPLKEGEMRVTPGLLKKMLQSSLDEMYTITTARVGDKTMMDTLIPAVESANKAEDTIVAILTAARDGAILGKKASEGFISHYGRAKSYKEKTIGTPDAGAVSTAVLFEGLLAGFLS